MIELRNVTTIANGEGKGLENYSRIFENGNFYRLDMKEGLPVINALIGFHPVVDGFITFDGAVLTPCSITFLRKLMGYIPSPEGFDNVDDLSEKQRQMIEKAIASEARIVLAINPTSHQDELQSVEMVNKLKQCSVKDGIVIVASDNEIM